MPLVDFTNWVTEGLTQFHYLGVPLAPERTVKVGRASFSQMEMRAEV